jgi:dipeptidyl aminopeptidase/acylaminoacyl peptidase
VTSARSRPARWSSPIVTSSTQLQPDGEILLKLTSSGYGLAHAGLTTRRGRDRDDDPPLLASHPRAALSNLPHPMTGSQAAVGSTTYTEREVHLPGGAPDVTLAGTLSVPSRQGPHPAVVLMSGSGPQDRDESVPGLTIKPFALVADGLARAGIAVLRYDDRGVGGSTGDHAAAGIDDFTADATAAVRWLRDRAEVDPTRVGVLGHSEGGIYAAHIAADDPDVAFVVGLAPVARSGWWTRPRRSPGRREHPART